MYINTSKIFYMVTKKFLTLPEVLISNKIS